MSRVIKSFKSELLKLLKLFKPQLIADATDSQLESHQNTLLAD